MKKRFLAYNILIVIMCLLTTLFSLMLTFAYQQPTGLKQQTGSVVRFDQYDEKWYDSLLDGSATSYFNMELEDGSFYEATGICYDNIDRELFEDVQAGSNITVTYSDVSGGLRKIYALEYNGKAYLLLDDVLRDFSQNERTAHIVGPIMIALSISVCIILFVVNYKKNLYPYKKCSMFGQQHSI